MDLLEEDSQTIKVIQKMDHLLSLQVMENPQD